MKQNKFWTLLSVGILSVAGTMTSCEDQPEKFELTDGTPVIHYVRPQKAAAKDSLLTEAFTGTPICIVGENLTCIREMYFNDQKAVLNTSYITNKTMLVTIPNSIPASNTGKIYMVNKDKDTTAYNFKVMVPAPVASALKNEYVKVGETATLLGQYFVNDPNQPLTITFTGINNSINVPVDPSTIKITPSTVTFTVPEGAEEGQIEVESIYGKSKSKFYYQDHRGLITDFDGPETNLHRSGSTTGIIPQGWNIAATYTDVNGVDGYYCQLGPDETEGGWTESLKLPFWCGNWNGDPMSITSGAGTPIRNAIDMSNWQNMSFKMELFIPKDNPWKAGAMQIMFVNNQQCANDSWQNNTYIHTSADGGLDLPRALYRPWAATGSFDTNDEWITVTIPLTDFIYNNDGTKAPNGMSISSFDSFIIWPMGGGVAGEKCTPIFRYDNLRLVPNL